MKPNFIVVGAAKAGTTTLCNLLGLHPQVYVFPPKETHYFSRRYERGQAWYESLFTPTGDELAIGEGSPSYTRSYEYPDAAERIARDLPNARLIYIVREPLARIESHFVQMVDNGKPVTTLEGAIESEPTLVDSSLYWKQISAYRERFPDDQIQVLFTEDLRNDQATLMRSCFEFLGVDPDVDISGDTSAKNTRAHKRRDTPFMAWFRRLRIYEDINMALPRPIVDRLKPLFRRKITVDVSWTESTKEKVRLQLREDTRRFLEFYGRSPDHWAT